MKRNPEASRLIGWELEEIIGKNQHQLLHHTRSDGTPYPASSCPIYAAYKDGKTHHVDNEVFWRKDGSSFPVEYTSTPIRDENGTIEGAVVTFKDITERQRAREEIDRVTNRLQTSIEQMPIAYILWNSDQKVLEWNKAAENIFGYTSKELLGKPFLELIVPEAVKPLVDKVVTDLFSGIPSSYSEKDNNIRKDGQLISCLWHNTPIKDEDGKITAVLSMTQDITKRLDAEEKLEKLAVFAKNNPAPLLRTDLEGRITLMNPAAKSLFKRDITGKPIGSYLPAFDLSACNLTSGDISMQFEQKFGDDIYLFIMHRDEPTQSLYIYGSSITETKRLQNLESRAQRLETAGKISGQIAHDFNNLLGPLMAYPEFVREELPKNHAALPYLRSIEESATRIADINQQLLTLGRRGHYNLEVLNLNEIIMRAVKEIDTQPETMTCELQLEENLMNIMGGGAQIHRVLSNLLLNAREAMLNVGRIKIKSENHYVDQISVAYERVPKGEFVKVTISDTGCGIPDEIIQKIFDPFFTSKATDRKRGSGLGLSIVDSVMKDHQGYLDLSTKVGEGTSFYLYFPITREDVGTGEAQKTLGGTETVLVVDDDELQRDVSSSLLVIQGQYS